MEKTGNTKNGKNYCYNCVYIQARIAGVDSLVSLELFSCEQQV